MTDFTISTLNRRCFGAISVLGALTAGGVLAAPAAAQAGAWESFQERCLAPMRLFEEPVVAGLDPTEEDEAGAARYALPGGGVLAVEPAPRDGRAACSVIAPSEGAAAAFDAWIADAVQSGRYIRVAPDVWHSYQWIEPVLQIEKWDDDAGLKLRALETRLES